MKKRNRQIRIVVIVLLIAVLNIGVVLWFNNTVFKELESSARSSLESMANEQSRAILLIINNKQDNVKGIVDVITHIGNNPSKLSNAMDIWAKEYEIDNLIITDTFGNGITSSGEIASISNEEYFTSTIQGEVGLTGVYDSQFTDKRVLAVTAPIYYEGKVEGTIVAEYDIEKLASLLIGVTDSRGASMIVNSQGEILFHTYEFPISFENFKSATFEDGKTYDGVLKDFANSEPGQVTFSIGGDRKLGEYVPLGVEDWTLFFEISESSLSDSANAITSRMVAVSASLLIAFLILTIYILWVRKKSYEEIQQVAYYDELTGVSNLIKFKMDLKEIVSQSSFDCTKYVLLKGDIENFKVINEVFGIEIGDKVICQSTKVAENMKGDLFKIARTGSDELLIFAEKIKVNEFFINKEKYINQLRASIPELDKHRFNYRYGRYFLEPKETDVDEMVNKVSIAHSHAREKTGWAIWDYDEKFKKHMLRMAEITNKMEDSLINKEFKMFLQPKYNPKAGTVVGAEALVRWFEDDGGIVFPGEFIPLFEKNEFILKLDEFIFETACIFIEKRIKEGKKNVPISVNFSRLHLQNEEFVERLIEIANKHNVPTNLLEVELTETTVIENIGLLSKVLDELHSAGFGVSIDDFGSGHSSLGMLKEYNFDVVKLDRSFFVAEDEKDRESAKTMLKGIINLVTSLGSKVVAEGIEYEDQVEFLQTVDCYSAQGYYFAKPMPSEELEKLLDEK